MRELTLKPHGERKIKPKWINRHISFESGKEQIHGVTVSPIYSWELRFQGVYKDKQYLETFFNAHKGSREKFYWKDRDGVKRIVRFAADELDITDKYGQAFECTVLLKEEKG